MTITDLFVMPDGPYTATIADIAILLYVSYAAVVGALLFCAIMIITAHVERPGPPRRSE